jgi:hypothetical protein
VGHGRLNAKKTTFYSEDGKKDSASLLAAGPITSARRVANG